MVLFSHPCLITIFFGFSGWAAAQTLEDSLSNFTSLFPTDPGYREAVSAFNRRFNLSPVGITYPASAVEVSGIVRVGANFGVPVVARSGGHNYIANGLGGRDGALVLDLSNLTTLEYDNSTGRAVISPGNRLGNIIPFLNDHGRGIPHGSCKYVGVGGHVSFGGFGSASRMWGLNLDAVVAVEIVLANGTIATVSESSYPELFWAARGSASSFGIITSITYQTHPVPESGINFSFEWVLTTAEASTSFLTMQSRLESYDYPATLYQQVAFWPASQKGTVQLRLNGVWFGDKAKLNETLAPFLAGLPTPGNRITGGGTWLEAMAFYSKGNLDVSTPDGIDNFYAKSLFTKQGHPVTKKAAEAFIGYLANEGVGSSASWFVQFDLYGGSNSAVNAVPQDATSYAHRDVFFNIQLYGTSAQAPFPSNGFELVDGMANAIINNSPPGWPYAAYMNYVDDRLNDWQRLYYGPHYKRLQHLKKRYDPHNVFRFPTSIELP